MALHEHTLRYRRAKLPWMRLKDLDTAVFGPTAPGDTLQVLCVLADWNPVCAKVEAQLEAANGALAEEAAARSGSEAARIKVGACGGVGGVGRVGCARWGARKDAGDGRWGGRQAPGSRPTPRC